MCIPVVIRDATNKQWLGFYQPEEIVATYRIEDVEDTLRYVEKMVNTRGFYAAGFISYEASPAFDKAFTVRKSENFPLVWFGLYHRADRINLPETDYSQNKYEFSWTPTVKKPDYENAISKIKKHLQDGDTYQINYTFRLHTHFDCNPWDFFLNIVKAGQMEYAAYIDTGRYSICSISPELFFHLDGQRLLSRPMKGTAQRGLTLEQDNDQVSFLHQSEKNRAENLMIVDMIRNDMGRIAKTGTVEVPDMFTVERYPTLLQMTSSVSALTQASLCEILSSLFPCASITGAPKIKSMEIIANLESSPRRIYTGCIGFMTPQRKAQFNVAIRTAIFDKEKNQAEYGTGSGIVWDSISSEEYSECLTKAKVLTQTYPDFSLLETMLWSPEDGFFLVEYHMRRLANSATYFNFKINIEKIKERLTVISEALPGKHQIIRLLIDSNGIISSEERPVFHGTPAKEATVKLAASPIDSSNPFLYHKTTNRSVYDLAKHDNPLYDDVLLWNEREEITETSIANVVFELNGNLFTPPVKSGLLPGTFRQWLLEQGTIQERVIRCSEIKPGTSIYLINSVRKWRKAKIDI